MKHDLIIKNSLAPSGREGTRACASWWVYSFMTTYFCLVLFIIFIIILEIILLSLQSFSFVFISILFDKKQFKIILLKINCYFKSKPFSFETQLICHIFSSQWHSISITYFTFILSYHMNMNETRLTTLFVRLWKILDTINVYFSTIYNVQCYNNVHTLYT